MKFAPDSVLFSLVADALALGPHWVYEPDEIQARLGGVERYHAPMTTYHAGKQAGDLTHYGDQALLLLRSLRKFGGYDFTGVVSDWRAFWESPSTVAYRDGATRGTLANLQAGLPPEKAASASHDLSAAGRVAPLFLLDWPDDAALISAVRAVVGFTHGDAAVRDAAEFFTRVTLAVGRGQGIPEALASPEPAALLTGLKAGRDSAASSLSDAEALARHGLSCDVAKGFPGVCHLLLRHPESPAVSLRVNAAAGGDSAARGMILGMVYGARFGREHLPTLWVEELRALPELELLLG